MSNLSKNILNSLGQILGSASTQPTGKLNSALRLLAKWRSLLIQNTLIQNHGTVVLSGPLKGLDFVEESSEGCHVPKLLGCYEQPLQPFIQSAIERNYDSVLNIGCAEGYYAVGLSLVMPITKMYAFDTDLNAQKNCLLLAEKNGVAARVIIGPRFDTSDFKDYDAKNTLIFCDIEGAELELLDPSIAPTLVGFDIIVESHECLVSGITQTLVSRFSKTHTITQIDDSGYRILKNLPKWFSNLNHLDQLLAMWEWRSGPTPWLVMIANRQT
jgi:hypothetical protein